MKHTIMFKDWTYTCGEPGCCYDWGVDVFVDGKKLAGGYPNREAALADILAELGVDAEIIDLGEYE